jgi:hypothetical protein
MSIFNVISMCCVSPYYGIYLGNVAISLIGMWHHNNATFITMYKHIYHPLIAHERTTHKTHGDFFDQIWSNGSMV